MAICKFCNKEIEIKTRFDSVKIFCNRSCRTSFNNTKRVVTDEQKQKCRESLLTTLIKKGVVKDDYSPKRKRQPKQKCTRCDKLTISSHGLCNICAHKPYKCKRCEKPSSSEFCLVCIRLTKTETIIEKILCGTYDSNNLRRIKDYIIHTRGHACEICHQTEWMGQPIPLVLDHINGRSSENRLDNLRVVCGNCDMQLPTYKSKNKNSDRKARKDASRK